MNTPTNNWMQRLTKHRFHGNMDLLLFTYMFSFLYHWQDLYQIWLYIRVNSYKKQELLYLAGTWVHSRFLVGSLLLIKLVFCVLHYLFPSCVACAHCDQCLWIRFPAGMVNITIPHTAEKSCLTLPPTDDDCTYCFVYIKYEDCYSTVNELLVQYW
jgi:hypothetical protein